MLGSLQKSISDNSSYWLVGLILLYIGLITCITLGRYQNLHTSIFDLGIFDQGLYLTSRGLEPFLTTRGVYVQQDHFQPIMYGFAPLYLVASSPQALMIFQSLMVALGAIPAYGLARRFELEPPYALLISAAYLFHPGVAYVNQFDFHPVSAMMTALMFAVWYLETANGFGFAIALVLALLSTESAGVTTFFLAMSATWIRGIRWGVGAGAASVLAIVVAKLSLGAYEQGSPYAVIFSDFGSNEIEVIKYLLSNPFRAIGRLATDINIRYFWQLLAPLAFLSVLSPARVWPALPALMANLLSWREAQHRLGFHYTASISPFLIWAAVAGWWWLKERRGTPSPRLALGLTLAILYGLNFGPFGTREVSTILRSRDVTDAKRIIGAQDVVCADNTLGSQFSQRDCLYTFPNPIVNLAWGNAPETLVHQASREYTPFTRGELRRGIEAAEIDWIALPEEPKFGFPMRLTEHLFIRDQLLRSSKFRVIEDQDEVLLLNRGNQ